MYKANYLHGQIAPGYFLGLGLGLGLGLELGLGLGLGFKA